MKRTKYYKEELEKQMSKPRELLLFPPKKPHIIQICKGMLDLCRILEDFCFHSFHMLVFQKTCKAHFSSALRGYLCFA